MVPIEEGKPNPFLDQLWAHMPEQIGKKIVVADESINAADMLPDAMNYCRFNGFC
jgi:carbonic anhydrase